MKLTAATLGLCALALTAAAGFQRLHDGWIAAAHLECPHLAAGQKLVSVHQHVDGSVTCTYLAGYTYAAATRRLPLTRSPAR